ncbi:hypothetical protein CERSUDRAFT_114268 [Gelatoporia subvermispora B]|uniref:Velvet domain-containing protein n=1 Tax=Ceriporiopsis subvermispora (strain B) TaxID=914234 RepID=M2QZH9_CERS8|nr:hypothetical protein CERSUDRAFT_114268 [Gelatoporia subvermispora B]
MIGAPVTFAFGPLAGYTIRGELEKMQKAESGRKFTQKDRRPLDPPPVARLRLFQIVNLGTPREYEVEFEHYEEAVAFGMTCHLDIFPVCGGDDTTSVPSDDMEQPQMIELPPLLPSAIATSQLLPLASIGRRPVPHLYSIPLSLTSPDLSRSAVKPSLPLIPSYHGTSRVIQFPALTLPPMTLRALLPRHSAEARPTPPLAFRPPRLSYSMRHPGADAVGRTTPSDVVAYLNDYAITERSVCTRWLAGSICVDATVIDFEGKQMLVFVFSDVAVRLEGTFVLRYRTFNVHARTTGERNIPVFAQRYGGPFKV